MHGSPSKVITDILSKGGIEMFTEKGGANVKMKHVLNYLIDTKGLDKTIGGLVRHHKAGAYGSPTSDYQILNKIINSRISGIEGRIRADQILPEDIAKLKKWGASVTHKGVTYGGGPKTAIGGLREIENLILKGSTDVELYGKKIKGIEKWNKKEYRFTEEEFQKYIQIEVGLLEGQVIEGPENISKARDGQSMKREQILAKNLQIIEDQVFRLQEELLVQYDEKERQFLELVQTGEMLPARM